MKEGTNLYQNFYRRDLSYGSNIRNMWISILIHCDFKQLFYYFYCTAGCCRTGVVTHMRYYAVINRDMDSNVHVV